MSEGDRVPTCSVFIGMSLDGFIARPNGDLDWLMGDGGGDSAEYGYNEFIAGIDAIVMGRRTFETVLTFGTWYYGDKRVVVLSSRPVDLAAAHARGGVVEQTAGPPATHPGFWGYVAITPADTVRIYQYLLDEAPATVLNSIMDITRAGGKLGIPGLYVTGDPGGGHLGVVTIPAALAVAERQGGVSGKEVVAIAFGHAAMNVVATAGIKGFDGLAQSKADDVANDRVGQNLQTQIDGGGADAGDDARFGIHQGAVPVEDDGIHRADPTVPRCYPRRRADRPRRDPPPRGGRIRVDD